MHFLLSSHYVQPWQGLPSDSRRVAASRILQAGAQQLDEKPAAMSGSHGVTETSHTCVPRQPFKLSNPLTQDNDLEGVQEAWRQVQKQVNDWQCLVTALSL